MCSDLFQIPNSVQNIRSFNNFGMEWNGMEIWLLGSKPSKFV